MLNKQELKEIEARCEASKFFTCDDPDFICPFPSDTPHLLAHIRELERIRLLLRDTKKSIPHCPTGG